MKNTLLFCALCALWGCKQADAPENEGIALSYSTSEQSKTDALAQGDAIGVFAAIEGTENNFLENAKYIVGTDGRSLSTTPAVYYPDAQQAVRFFAYFPYGSGATFSVPSDQSTATALKQADLCWAAASSTPVAAAVPLEFTHKLARLLITTNTPTTKIAIPNAFSGGTLDIKTGTFTNTLRSEVFTTGTELIVPAQPLTRLLLTVSGVEHPFTPALPLNLPAGQTTTLNLTLNPITKTATLSGSSTTNWVGSATQGNPTQAVSNAFTIHWLKCHPQSASVDRIVLTTKDLTSGTTTEHTISSGITYADQTFAAPFASSTLRYPYVLLDVALYQANTWIHSSGSILGATIVKSGACVVGVRQPLNPPAESDYIKIGSLYWAKGNLVAVSKENNRECKVGAPADHGLYFQFGSLIGHKGGALANGGTGVGSTPLGFWGGATSYSWENDAMVWPEEMVGYPAEWQMDDWGSSLNHYYFNYTIAPWHQTAADIRNFAVSFTGDKGSGKLSTGRYAPKGIGDPCSYYLGSTWKLPITTEHNALCNNKGTIYWQWFHWSQCNASWTTSPVNGGNFMGTSLFIPASGTKTDPGIYGGATSSAAYGGVSNAGNAPNGWTRFMLSFNEKGIFPQNSHYNSFAHPARCVSDAP